jgi:HSP20 family protein
MHHVNESMNHLFENFGLGPTGLAQLNYPAMRQAPGLRAAGTADRGQAMVYPDIEVLQRQNGIVVRADLPGLDADDISVYVDDGALVISGERQREHREDREGYVRSEVRYGTFFRTIPLPRGADEDKIGATFKNGVLEVSVPINGEQQGKRIAINS